MEPLKGLMQTHEKAGGLWSEVFTIPPEAMERLFGKESLRTPTEMAQIAALYRTTVQNMINQSLQRQRELQAQANQMQAYSSRIVGEAMNNLAQLEAKLQEVNLQRDLIALQGIATLLSQASQNWDKWFGKTRSKEEEKNKQKTEDKSSDAEDSQSSTEPTPETKPEDVRQRFMKPNDPFSRLLQSPLIQPPSKTSNLKKRFLEQNNPFDRLLQKPLLSR